MCVELNVGVLMLALLFAIQGGIRFEFPTRTNQILDVRFKVPLAVSMENCVLQGMTPYSLSRVPSRAL